jgi:hypothetical protein
MLLELAKPLSLVFCILSLYAVFYAAFLNPGSDLDQTIYDSLGLLALSAGISLVSGLIFREPMQPTDTGSVRLTTTLPVRMFCWASAAMLVFFVVAWYLETYCVFYRDVRPNV